MGATDTVRAHPELPRERTYTCGVTGSMDTPWRGGRGHAVEDLSTRTLSQQEALLPWAWGREAVSSGALCCADQACLGPESVICL